MKTRICLILLALMVTFSLVGCQRSAAKTDDQTAVVEESPKPKPTKTAPPQNKVRLSWTEPCSVEQATSAAKRVLEDLGLGGSGGTTKTRTVTTRDPKTGRTISKKVPVNTGTGSGSVYSKSDGLSAIVKAKSVTGVDYLVTILLMPPESCEIAIIATGPNPTDILSKHGKFIKNKISEGIQQQPDISDSIPYPKTMLFDRTVYEVSGPLFDWYQEMSFSKAGGGRGDLFYREHICATASGIRFTFKMWLLNTNKTKLQIDIQNYEGKEEFPMILKSLEEVLDGIGQSQPEPVSQETAKPKRAVVPKKSCQGE